MAFDHVAFWAMNFQRDVQKRADRLRTEADHERWVVESREWMTHLVEKEACRQGMTDDERKRLADACVRAFNEISASVCERLFAGPVPTLNVGA